MLSWGLDNFKIYLSWRRGWLGIHDAKEIHLFLDIFSFSIVCWGFWYPFIQNISNYFESILNINLVLYRSESPTQACLILAVWLYRRFKTQQDAGKPLAEIESAMQSTVLAYDNMCMWTVWRFPRRIFHSQNHLIRPGTWLLKSLTGYTWETTKTKSAKPFIIQMARFHPNLILCPVNKLLYGQVDLNISCAPCQGSINFSTFIGLLNVAILTPNDVINQAKIRCYLNSHTHRFHRRKK